MGNIIIKVESAQIRRVKYPLCPFVLGAVHIRFGGFPQVALVGTNPPAIVRDRGLIPGLGRSPGEGNGYSTQYSCLENPMGRGAWWAVTEESDTAEAT